MATFEVISAAAIGGGSGSGVGYTAGTKIYVALLTQTGTDAPVATVLQNTLGGTLVWTYSDIGSYIGTLLGAFTENKSILMFQNMGWDDSPRNYLARIDDNSIALVIQAGDGALTAFSSAFIQILVFP